MISELYWCASMMRAVEVLIFKLVGGGCDADTRSVT